MIGVNILGQELELCKNPVFTVMFGVGITVAVILFILLIVDLYEKIRFSWKLYFVFVLGVALAFTGGTLMKKKPNVKYMKYYVTINDDVSWKDFVSKYEVVDQVGDLYIVKETSEQNS